MSGRRFRCEGDVFDLTTGHWRRCSYTAKWTVIWLHGGFNIEGRCGVHVRKFRNSEFHRVEPLS